MTPRSHSHWLFSPAIDLATFGGSAALALLALAGGASLGWLESEPPRWTWIAAVLLIDVAHVWSTLFRVYLDPVEFRRRPGVYCLIPVIGFLLGLALYSFGAIIFWRCLAYLAVFHFVRQQYGWVMLYRARLGERDPLGKWIDTFAIYLATIYPLVHWHAHLPRRFWWFLEGDFQAIPAQSADLLEPIYWAALGLYATRCIWRLGQGIVNPGKDLVVFTTALCWYIGIITFNSDYSFTVTNVVIHGIPYLVLVYWYGWMREHRTESVSSRVRTIAIFVAAVWVLAFAEELLWDKCVWHERDWLFGANWPTLDLRGVLVPLLALPQFTHYVLDGLIWRRQANPAFTLIR